jgi:hypothetical protein
MAAQIVIRLFLLAGVCALFAGSIAGLLMLNRPKPHSRSGARPC